MPAEPKRRGRPRKTVSQEEPVYHFTLTLGNEVYQSEAPTALEALRALPKPIKITTKGKLLITYGNLKKELLYMPAMCKRIFYPAAQKVIIKDMITGLR